MNELTKTKSQSLGLLPLEEGVIVWDALTGDGPWLVVGVDGNMITLHKGWNDDVARNIWRGTLTTVRPGFWRRFHAADPGAVILVLSTVLALLVITILVCKFVCKFV